MYKKVNMKAKQENTITTHLWRNFMIIMLLILSSPLQILNAQSSSNKVLKEIIIRKKVVDRQTGEMQSMHVDEILKFDKSENIVEKLSYNDDGYPVNPRSITTYKRDQYGNILEERFWRISYTPILSYMEYETEFNQITEYRYNDRGEKIHMKKTTFSGRVTDGDFMKIVEKDIKPKSEDDKAIEKPKQLTNTISTSGLIMWYPPSNQKDVEYHENGKLKSWHYFNGGGEGIIYSEFFQKYDTNGKLISRKIFNKEGVLHKTEKFEYNSKGDETYYKLVEYDIYRRGEEYVQRSEERITSYDSVGNKLQEKYIRTYPDKINIYNEIINVTDFQNTYW